MLNWDSFRRRGRRESDAHPIAPAAPARDLLIESAIAHERIELLYQPLIEVETGRVIGVEALARSPISASPEMLFARAISSGLGERLSRLVQRKALLSASIWEGPLKSLKISINLLPADICRNGYEHWLLDEIGAAGIDPSRIALEITESALLVDREAVAARLARLRDAGIAIALDDFGTGYASLGYLTALPLDMLKIDGGLIAGIATDRRNRIVVEAIIRLARELGLQIVVEGVESAEQLALVADWGCDVYQGFHGAAPLTHEDLSRFIQASELEPA